MKKRKATSRPDSPDISGQINAFYDNNQAWSQLNEWENFIELLRQQNNQSDLRDFLLSKNEAWNDVRSIFFLSEDKQNINSKLIEKIASDYAAADFYNNFKKVVQSGDLMAYDDSDSDHIQSLNSSTVPRLKPVVVANQVIRGEIKTYAKSMMGGFKYYLKEFRDENGNRTRPSILYVDENSTIIRPKGIVGNLGPSMGAHVVPFAAIIEDIAQKVKGKEVFEAIEILRNMIGYDTSGTDIDRYQNLIDKTKVYLDSSERDLEAQLRAFSFLSWEFIPSIVAIHNQTLGTAFEGKKVQAELLAEARSVHSFLAKERGERIEDIKNFIHEIDYSPVTNPASLEAGQSRSLGLRTNNINDLSDIIGDVVDVFFRLYAIDAKDSLDVTTSLIKELLQEKGWLEYYNNNQDDLGSNFINIDSDPLDNLSNYVLNYIRENRAMLIADNESAYDSSTLSSAHSSGSKDHDHENEDDPESNGEHNFKRFEKSFIDQSQKFINILYQDLSTQQQDIINEMNNIGNAIPTSVKKTKNKIPTVTLIPEDDYILDHKINTQRLIQMINDNQIDTSTVICLERKEDGINFGMQHVRLLASIIEHNQHNLYETIVIPTKIQNSLIYQDAMLYNAAKLNGIEVIGLEGKGLQHNKESPEYNTVREAYMVERIEQIATNGKNIIFPVGTAHINALKERLSTINQPKPYITLVNTLKSSTAKSLIADVATDHMLMPITRLKAVKKGRDPSL